MMYRLCQCAAKAFAFNLALLVLTAASCSGPSEVQPGVHPPAGFDARQPGRFFGSFDLETDPLPFGLIAHALGTVDGRIYSNSREAFEESLAKGFRLFEVDLMPLSDGSLVALHPGAEPCCSLPAPIENLSRRDLSLLRFDGRYPLLWAEDIVSLLQENPEILLIADSKTPLPESLRRLVEAARDTCPTCMDRVIPHVSSEEELLSQQAIYPFRDYMFAVYRSSLSDSEVVNLIQKYQLKGAMMHWSWPRTPALTERLRRIGVNCYVHSLGDPLLITDFLHEGVGVYSDGFFPTRGLPPESEALSAAAENLPWWKPAQDTASSGNPPLNIRIGTCAPGAVIDGPGMYCLTFSDLRLRQVDVRFHVNGGEPGVMQAIVNAHGEFRSFVPCGTPPGHYLFDAIRFSSSQEWIVSTKPAELQVR